MQAAQQESAIEHGLKIAERMLGGGAAKPHETGIVSSALMGAFGGIGIPGARNATAFTLRAVRLQRTVSASARPVKVGLARSIVLVAAQYLPSRTAIGIVLLVIDEHRLRIAV